MFKLSFFFTLLYYANVFAQRQDIFHFLSITKTFQKGKRSSQFPIPPLFHKIFCKGERKISNFSIPLAKDIVKKWWDRKFTLKGMKAYNEGQRLRRLLTIPPLAQPEASRSHRL